MAVRLFLASGARRDIDDADGARMDGPFFFVTRWAGLQRTETVLTLRSEDVVSAEIEKEGGSTEIVLGAAGPRRE